MPKMQGKKKKRIVELKRDSIPYRGKSTAR